MVDRYCRNCGHELRGGDAFCPGCGRPTHETARVSTPEADVPIPPPPVTAVAQESGRTPPRAGRILLVGGLGALLVLVLIGVGLAALGRAGDSFAGGRGGVEQNGLEEAGQQPAESPDGPRGYVLLPEGNTGPYGELLFLQLVREGAERPEGGQAMRGYLTSTAPTYELDLTVVRSATHSVEGTIDDASLQFTEELYTGGSGSASAASTYYYGTLEGARMELTRESGSRTTWVGEEGTLGDYHEEVERLVIEGQDEADNLRD